jgi:hypothetical protein
LLTNSWADAKASNFREFVDEILAAYRTVGCNMAL